MCCCFTHPFYLPDLRLIFRGLFWDMQFFFLSCFGGQNQTVVFSPFVSRSTKEKIKRAFSLLQVISFSIFSLRITKNHNFAQQTERTQKLVPKFTHHFVILAGYLRTEQTKQNHVILTKCVWWLSFCQICVLWVAQCYRSTITSWWSHTHKQTDKFSKTWELDGSISKNDCSRVQQLQLNKRDSR